MFAPTANLKVLVCATVALVLTAATTWTLAEGVYTAESARGTVTVEADADLIDQAPVHLAQAG